MKCKGGNILLVGAKGGITAGIRKDFKYIDEVNNIIYSCFVAFDVDSNNIDNSIIPRVGKYIV